MFYSRHFSYYFILVLFLSTLWQGIDAEKTKKKKPNSPLEFPSYVTLASETNFAALKPQSSDDPKKIAKGLEKKKIDVLGIIGASDPKQIDLITRLKKQDYTVFSVRNGVILGTKTGTIEHKEPGVIITFPNKRKVYVTGAADGDLATIEAKAAKAAAKLIKDQNPDFVVFYSSTKDNSLKIKVAPHLRTRATTQNTSLSIAKSKIELVVTSIKIPKPTRDLSIKKTFKISILMLLIPAIVIPAISAIIAIILVKRKNSVKKPSNL